MITSKPNCLLITTSFPAGGIPGSESAGAFVEDFARALSDIAEVRVIAPALEAGIEKRGGVRVNYFKVPRIPLSLMSPARPSDWLAIFRALRSGDQTVAEEIARETPDHILALWALPSGYWARRHARRAHIPYSNWALGSDIWSLARLPGVREVLAATLRDAQYCYADGEQLRVDVATHAKRDCEFLASARFLPVPERSNFALQPPYKLAFLGRWHVNKGIDILLDALGELNDGDWQKIAAVRIAGGGPLQARVETAIQSLKAAGRPVQMHGFLGRDAAADTDPSDRCEIFFLSTFPARSLHEFQIRHTLFLRCPDLDRG